MDLSGLLNGFHLSNRRMFILIETTVPTLTDLLALRYELSFLPSPRATQKLCGRYISDLVGTTRVLRRSPGRKYCEVYSKGVFLWRGLNTNLNTSREKEVPVHGESKIKIQNFSLLWPS